MPEEIPVPETNIPSLIALFAVVNTVENAPGLTAVIAICCCAAIGEVANPEMGCDRVIFVKND